MPSLAKSPLAPILGQRVPLRGPARMLFHSYAKTCYQPGMCVERLTTKSGDLFDADLSSFLEWQLWAVGGLPASVRSRNWHVFAGWAGSVLSGGACSVSSLSGSVPSPASGRPGQGARSARAAAPQASLARLSGSRIMGQPGREGPGWRGGQVFRGSAFRTAGRWPATGGREYGRGAARLT